MLCLSMFLVAIINSSLYPALPSLSQQLHASIGLVIFAAASTLSVVCDTTSQLIAVRAVMGVGAGLIMASTLSILANVFQRLGARHRHRHQGGYRGHRRGDRPRARRRVARPFLVGFGVHRGCRDRGVDVRSIA